MRCYSKIGIFLVYGSYHLWHIQTNLLVESFSQGIFSSKRFSHTTLSEAPPYFGDYIIPKVSSDNDDSIHNEALSRSRARRASVQGSSGRDMQEWEHPSFSFPPTTMTVFQEHEEEVSEVFEETSSTTPSLSGEQSLALELIQEGKNVFVTGVAGTGKSLLLKKTLEYVQDTYEDHEYVALAPTGSTAIALEGQTMHSFAGIGIPKIYTDFRKMKSNKKLKKKWQDLKVLILDEVSMVSGEFFDSLSKVVSDIRKDPRPFGGIQLVVCGDFLQLSPIAPRQWEVDQMVTALIEKEDLDTPEEARDWLFLNRGFCFQSVAWKEANFHLVELLHVFRQSNQDFVGILQDIRVGKVTDDTIRYLKEHCERPLPENEFGIQPTILHSKNVNVAKENLVDLHKLEGDIVTFEALDEVEKEPGTAMWVKNDLEKNSFFKSCHAEHELKLKIGAQVMLIKNLNQNSRLVNGSRGTVVGFRKVKASSGHNLLPGVTKYPVVRFKNGLQQVITPQKFQSRILGKGTCTRTAIPLKLAWAITAHKAQGLTMDYVIADVGEVFAEAQCYVALSRASDASGLELRNFSKDHVRTNPLALRFHQNPHQQYPFWWDSDASKPMIMIDSSLQKTRKRRRKAPQPNADDKLRALSLKRVGPEGSSNPSPIYNEQNLKMRTVAELKSLLREKGWKVSGNKTELIDRLLQRSTFQTTNNHSSSQTVWNEQSLNIRTVPELKAMLRERGLKVSGKKAELVQRLLADAASN